MIEAMKMQNELRAPRAGRIERVYMAEGRGVETGARLLRTGVSGVRGTRFWVWGSRCLFPRTQNLASRTRPLPLIGWNAAGLHDFFRQVINHLGRGCEAFRCKPP